MLRRVLAVLAIVHGYTRLGTYGDLLSTRSVPARARPSGPRAPVSSPSTPTAGGP
jgi:hypothetical protein